jgi:hypothetical protein
MSKLDAIKNKLAAIREKALEKVDKIAFIKKWLEKKAPSPSPNAPEKKKAPEAHSLGEIYRQGGTGTRLQVLLVFTFGLAALIATGLAIKKMASRFRSSVEHEKIKKDYAKEFEDFSKRVQTNASVISIGSLTINAYVGEGKSSLMSLDLWARMSDPQAADFAQKNDLILHDKALDALNDLFLEKVNLLSEQGKVTARNRIIEKINRVLPKGKVEEVFFHNLVAQ